MNAVGIDAQSDCSVATPTRGIFVDRADTLFGEINLIDGVVSRAL